MMDAVHWSPVLKAPFRRQANGAETRHFSQFQFGGLASPFLNIDHFKISRPAFPPHPLAGFSAVTYLLEDSPGGLLSRDSLGDRSEVSRGDLHWTLAARGLVHEEVPQPAGLSAEGLQIFVNLKEKHKALAPASFHVENLHAPRVLTRNGAVIKVCAGSYQGMHAPFRLPEETDLFDATMDIGASFPLELKQGCGGLLYVLKGSITVDCDSPFGVREGSAVAFRVKDPVEVMIRASKAAKLIVLQGKVTDEPIVFQGPFAMTNEADVQEARRRYQEGEMGRLDS
ncbi:MAG: pirin family protein [Proteobacteria bacterium]|nr:MAG: pirin family protein [Pseudomonadota bacterium]